MFFFSYHGASMSDRFCLKNFPLGLKEAEESRKRKAVELKLDERSPTAACKGWPKKDHIPFPATETEDRKIEWLLQQVRVYSYHLTRMVTFRTNESNALALRDWCATMSGSLGKVLAFRMRKHPSSSELAFKWKFAWWLEDQARKYGFNDSAFHVSLTTSNAKVEAFKQEVKAVRGEILEGLYRLQGHEGCADCKALETEDGVHLELDHMQPLDKTDEVTALLWEGKFDEARNEARKCQPRCSCCHIQKTVRNREGSPRRVSSDPKVEKHRAKRRLMVASLLLRGKERLRDAKLKLVCCAYCKKLVTPDRLEDFQFDHLIPANKKKNLGQMVLSSNETFSVELAKCQLLCHACHQRRTKEQRKEM